MQERWALLCTPDGHIGERCRHVPPVDDGCSGAQQVVAGSAPRVAAVGQRQPRVCAHTCAPPCTLKIHSRSGAGLMLVQVRWQAGQLRLLLCDQRAVGDERHMVFECPALLSVRDKYAALFVDGASTMQQFMWQQDVIGVAHFVQDCFDLLDAPV